MIGNFSSAIYYVDGKDKSCCIHIIYLGNCYKFSQSNVTGVDKGTGVTPGTHVKLVDTGNVSYTLI